MCTLKSIACLWWAEVILKIRLCICFHRNYERRQHDNSAEWGLPSPFFPKSLQPTYPCRHFPIHSPLVSWISSPRCCSSRGVAQLGVEGGLSRTSFWPLVNCTNQHITLLISNVFCLMQLCWVNGWHSAVRKWGTHLSVSLLLPLR